MSILIQQPGILTTMQDLGRFGYRRLGINPGGAMDRQAVRLINGLLQNEENAAVLEMHFPAARVLFEEPCLFAIGGADLSPLLDGETITNWRSIRAEKGSDLRFVARSMGNRAYLAVAGGFTGDEWLGSSSTNLVAKVGGVGGRKLATGDRVHFRDRVESISAQDSIVSTSMIPRYGHFPTVRVTIGPEYRCLDQQSMEQFGSATFKISNNSSRMGFRLNGPGLGSIAPINMISSAVDMGTIQLLPDGQMIVLMADHQTTGGYPRIANVIDRDMSVFAQLGSGDKVAFHLIEHAESEYLNAKFERNMSTFLAGCRLAGAA